MVVKDSTMKLVSFSLLLVSSQAFVLSSKSSSSGRVLQATVEKTELKPPLDLKDLSTSDLYNSNVQKTYG